MSGPLAEVDRTDLGESIPNMEEKICPYEAEPKIS